MVGFPKSQLYRKSITHGTHDRLNSQAMECTTRLPHQVMTLGSTDWMQITILGYKLKTTIAHAVYHSTEATDTEVNV